MHGDSNESDICENKRVSVEWTIGNSSRATLTLTPKYPENHKVDHLVVISLKNQKLVPFTSIYYIGDIFAMFPYNNVYSYSEGKYTNTGTVYSISLLVWRTLTYKHHRN